MNEGFDGIVRLKIVQMRFPDAMRINNACPGWGKHC